MLLDVFIRAAASRTFCTAGKSRPMRTAMIAITTRSSISVNADRGREGTIVALQENKSTSIPRTKYRVEKRKRLRRVRVGRRCRSNLVGDAGSEPDELVVR